MDILGERKNDDDVIFENLVYSAYHNKILRKWVEKAGIEKHITYHSSRHTFATLHIITRVSLGLKDQQ